MPLRVPVLQTERDSPIHRRDPRTKLVLFALLVLFLYIAPSWPWMLAMTFLGLAMALAARVPGRWLLVLWLLQLPSFLGLVIIPSARDLLAGDLALYEGDLAFGLRLGFAWSAALFVSISLLSTMQVDELTDGMRGLGIPEVICFTFGYGFLLMYTSLNDVFRIADAMRVKGVDLETKNPLRWMVGLPRLMVPAIFTIVRRASTMMAVLEMRGFSFSKRPARRVPSKFDAADAVFLVGGMLVFGLAVGARLDLIPYIG